MTHNKDNALRRAAQMRASQIRSLRGIRISLIEDAQDRAEMQRIIDRQLASMGAETATERTQRFRDSLRTSGSWDFDSFHKTSKPYKMTKGDIRRYQSW